MKKLLALSRLALGLAVALFLGGASLGPLCLADNVIPTGPFCSDCVLTNITFYSVDQFDEFVEVAEIGFDACLDCFDDYDQRVNLIRARCNNISNACDTISGNLQFIVGSEYYSYVNAIGSSVADIRAALGNTWGSGIVSQLDSIQHQMSSARDDVELCRDYFENDVVAYRVQVATSCEPSFSGGSGGSTGCCCPDYTQYIDEVEDYLRDLNYAISNLNSAVAGIASELSTIRQILVQFRLEVHQISSYTSDITDYTYYIGTMILSVLDACDMALGTNSNFDPESAGGTTGRFAGLYLYSQLVLNQGLTNIFQRLASRDWWNWRGAMYSSPDYNDFVDFTSLGIQGLTGLVMPDDDSSAWPIVRSWRDFYYLRNVHPTNELSNPLWVAFTNSVKLDPALLDSNRLKISVEAYSSSALDSLANMLTNLVLNVSMVTNNVTIDVENEYETSVDILDEEMEETSDVEQDTVEMPTESVSFTGIGSVLTRVVNSYASMFTVIPDEPPSDITVYKGKSYVLPGQDEAFEVQSIHWRPFADSRSSTSRESKVFNAIRVVFRFGWTVLYVLLIYAATAVDLFIVGICGYAVWGVFMGRTDAMVKGFVYCYRVMCKMLGF